MPRSIKEATESTIFEESFMMGTINVRVIMDAYQFADGEYFVTASLWDDTHTCWIKTGTKRYANTHEATEAYIKKYNLTYQI